MYHDYVVERPNIYVDEEQIDKILPNYINNNYIIILIVCLTSAAVYFANMTMNQEIVKIEENKGHPSLYILFVLQVIIAIALSMIIFYSRKENRKFQGTEREIFLDCLGYGRLKSAFIIYIIVNIIWSTVLFHSRISRGLSGVLSVIMMVFALWICVCAYNYNPRTWFISLLFLIWNAYMLYYTYSVSLSPWEIS